MLIFSGKIPLWWQHYFFCKWDLSTKKTFGFKSCNSGLHVYFRIMVFTLAGRMWGVKSGFVSGILGLGEVKKTLKWPLATFPFIGGSSNIDKNLAHYVTYMCAKNEVDPNNGLGGVREHTYRQTYMVREI